MSEIILQAEPRTGLGGAIAKQMRATGRVPGVVYGHGEPSTAFHVKELDLRPLIYTNQTHIVKLQLSGGDTKCILREIQFDPITDRVIHIDFLKLHAGEKIKVQIPVKLMGTSAGSKDGGVNDHVMHKIMLNVLPEAIPDHIEVDISELRIGHSIHIKDLPPNDSYTIIGDENAVIVACAAPKVAEEVAAPGAVAAAVGTEVVEPEQIKTKGKKEEEA